MGLTLGLLGGGGGILTLPILVNLFGIKPSEATGGSLLVVGTTSLLAVLLELRSGKLDWKSIAWVGVPLQLVRSQLENCLSHSSQPSSGRSARTTRRC